MDPFYPLNDTCRVPIGREYSLYIIGCLQPAFYLIFQHYIFSKGIVDLGIILDKYECKKCKLSRFSAQIDA